MIYDLINKKEKGQIAVLIDPDKYSQDQLINVAKQSDRIDYFFVGGSLLSDVIDSSVNTIKKYSKCPVILFPGSCYQLSSKADALLLLSLISGRNPEYLIGQHVISSRFIKKSGLEVIPTGYILIEGKETSSVEYISNTKPIPAHKLDIIVSTALAGEMLGLKCIYLEAGSGASMPVSNEIVTSVKEAVSIPIIVGGGVCSINDIKNLWNSGADLIVIGNAIEKNPDFVRELSLLKK